MDKYIADIRRRAGITEDVVSLDQKRRGRDQARAQAAQSNTEALKQQRFKAMSELVEIMVAELQGTKNPSEIQTYMDRITSNIESEVEFMLGIEG